MIFPRNIDCCHMTKAKWTCATEERHRKLTRAQVDPSKANIDGLDAHMI
jgi:hypothetical protein